MNNSVDVKNNYRDISRNLLDFDISELSKNTRISKKDLKKYFIITL